MLKVVQHSDTSQALKENILSEIIQIGKMATYREYDIFDMDDLIQQIMLSVQSREEALATVNQLIMEKKEHLPHHIYSKPLCFHALQPELLQRK